MKPRQLFESVHQALRWHRRWFAAILAGIGVLAAITALAPTTSGTVPVVVAVHEVAAGATLSASDLAVVLLPREHVAEGAFTEVAALDGRVVVDTVPARGVLTTHDLAGTASLAAPGRVALPVRFGDAATLAVLQAGNRIDILGQTSADAKVSTLVRDVRVLSVPVRGTSGLGVSTGELVLIEVDGPEAATISAAAGVSALSFVLH